MAKINRVDSSIHPSAVIHPRAVVDPSVSVGPGVVIDADVVVGAGCRLGPHVYLTGRTVIGTGNVFHAGAVIGDAPQDLKYGGAPTGLRIGRDNTFRENVTVHRSNKMEEDTVVGSNNFLMAGSHVGHNSVVGDHVILANGALLGGHVVVQDRVFVSGNCLIHQFTRVGTLALMQGGAGVSKDIPPYTVARGVNRICGLNLVGLRRAGVLLGERTELKRLYHTLFRGGKNLSMAMASAGPEFTSDRARILLDFVQSARRGVCADFSNIAFTPEE